MNNRLLASFLLVAFSVPALAKPEPKTAPPSAIRKLVLELGDTYHGASMLKTRAKDPQKMIFAYLRDTYLPEDVAETRFVPDAKAWEFDDKVAGTLSVDKVIDQAMESLNSITYESTPEEKQQIADKVKELLTALATEGAIFGFDGHAQNEGPTAFLLILEPENRTVYGIDLSPSEPE